MKTSMFTKYATLAVLSMSFIAINNCGSQKDLSGSDFAADGNGQATDLLTGTSHAGAADIIGYPVSAALWPEINCNNGRDDNGNGLIDCEDPACHVHPECAEFGPPNEELINSRSLTIYPNGIAVPEDVVFRKARDSDDDDSNSDFYNGFFATSVKDCWINPLHQDPYSTVGGELLLGPYGPIGPQRTIAPALDYFMDPGAATYGPRRGLINECEPSTDLIFNHTDDDNAPGAGASSDKDDDDGGDEDDF